MSLRLVAFALGLLAALAALPGDAPSAEIADRSAARTAAVVTAVVPIGDIDDLARGSKRCGAQKQFGLGGPGCAAPALLPGDPPILSADGSATFDPVRASVPIGREPEPPHHPPRTVTA